MIVPVSDENRGRSHFVSALQQDTSGNNSLYNRESRRELRNVRAKPQHRASTDKVQCQDLLQRSRSADFSLVLEERSSSGTLLDSKKNATAGGVQREIQWRTDEDAHPRRSLSQRSSSQSKMTLDELFQSHHSRRGGRRRQRLMARNRFELRKSLSYGQMQDVTRNLSQSCLFGLNQSLHDIQKKRQLLLQPELLGEKLADMFEAAVQDNTPGAGLLIPKVRKLILALSVESMVSIVQHLDQCQIKKEPIQWDFLQSQIDPETTVDWDGQVLMQLRKASSQASGLGVKSDHGDSGYEEFSYESMSYYEEELSVGSSQSSYIHTDDGQNYKPFHLGDDDSDITGLSLEAYTECCNSSITFEDYASLCDPDESFALGGNTSHHLIVDVPKDFDASAYTEVVEESFIMQEEEEEVVIEETELEEEEEEIEVEIEDEILEEIIDAVVNEMKEGVSDEMESRNYLAALDTENGTEKRSLFTHPERGTTDDTATATDDSTVDIDETKATALQDKSRANLSICKLSASGLPQTLTMDRPETTISVESAANADKAIQRLQGGAMAARRFHKVQPTTIERSKYNKPTESKSFRVLKQSRKVSSLIAKFEEGCKS